MNWKYQIIKMLDVAGMSVFVPFVRLATGEEPREQLRKIALFIGVPILAFALFLGAWAVAAKSIVTNYGTVPTPSQVWAQAGNLWEAHCKTRADRKQFFAEQAEKTHKVETELAALKAEMVDATEARRKQLDRKATIIEKQLERVNTARFSAPPTYLDQILTSLKTVFFGFIIASAVAVPVGILCGLNPVFMAAASPLIQIFKPVSPLAWLPIVMIVVGALYVTPPSEAWFEKSFISSAITVALCSLWPTLVNTALGVASIDKDHINVARVLRLPWWSRLVKIVIPSALPLMFTGLRISLGVGWMVLIAAEMLAQNPGLGKFVWDMFQNGSSQTLAMIMVAVFTIGLIGFMLDRVMVVLQRLVSFDTVTAA